MSRRRFSTESYDISVLVTEGISLNNTTKILSGSRYVNQIIPNQDTTVIHPIIKMNNVDVTDTCWDDETNTVLILNVSGDLDIKVHCTRIISFQDSNVKALCVNNWGDNFVEGELTEYEASVVTSLGTVFKSNTTIVYFNELEYFTGLHNLNEAFNGCTALKQVKLPHTTWSGSFSMYKAFYNCSAITGTLDCSPIKANTVTSISECFYACHASNLIVPTTNKINQQIGWCFRGVRSVTLDLSPLAGSHLTIPNYCFYGWNNVTTFITTGVYINGASNDVILWHNANPCPVTTFIGGFMGWNKNLNLTYMPNIGHDGAMEVINSLATVTEKTLTFASAVYGTLTSDEAAIAINKGWSGAGLWLNMSINGINYPFGFLSASTSIGFRRASSVTPQVISNNEDISSTAVNAFDVTIPDKTAAINVNFTCTNLGTVLFSNTSDTGYKTSCTVIYSATQNGWYKVNVLLGNLCEPLKTGAKDGVLYIRRMSPYNTRYDSSIDYDNWKVINVENFTTGDIEAYGYLGVGDILVLIDAIGSPDPLDASATVNVTLVESISIPTGYALANAMPLGQSGVAVPTGLRIDHSIETKFKINYFETSTYWIGRYSTNRKYYIGRSGSAAAYILNTYWGKGASQPSYSALVNTSMLNNTLYFKADSTRYTVQRISNGTEYSDTYPSSSVSEATDTSFYIIRCELFWLKLRYNDILVRNIIPLVDKNARDVFKLYDLVEEEFITE